LVDALLIGLIAAEGICLFWCYRPDETAVGQPTGVMGGNSNDLAFVVSY
jgi:hypothetical protein